MYEGYPPNTIQVSAFFRLSTKLGLGGLHSAKQAEKNNGSFSRSQDSA